MESAFESTSAIEPSGDPGCFRWVVPDGWQQGRGAFGGLVLATLLRAIERTESDRARAPRTLLGDLCGPVLPGEAEIRVRTLRRGSNQTNARADLLARGELLAYASVVSSTPRPVALPGFGPRAAPPPFSTAAPLPDSEMRAVFARHFDFRPTGPLPFTGAAEPVVEGWVRAAEPTSAVDAPLLVALLDAYWPASFAMARGPRPMATVSFSAQLTCDPGSLDPAAPIFYRARAVNDHEGFELELRELFDEAGAVLAMNQQTFVVIK